MLTGAIVEINPTFFQKFFFEILGARRRRRFYTPKGCKTPFTNVKTAAPHSAAGRGKFWVDLGGGKFPKKNTQKKN